MDFYFQIIYLSVFLQFTFSKAPKVVTFQYHHYDDLVNVINQLNSTKCSGISRVFSIGKSVQNRDLIVMEISNKNYSFTDYRPTFYFAGNIHGNEPVSKEVLLHFVDDFCDAYNDKDPTVVRIVDNMDIHFLFSINPDGFEGAIKHCTGLVGRHNANDVDLNRNFPYLKFKPPNEIQPETTAVMKWIDDYEFVFSTVLHGGEVTVVYPYDGDGTKSSRWMGSSDHAFIGRISRKYVVKAKNYKMRGCYNKFKHGVTNGAMWYPLVNSLQDYTMYRTSGLHITLELSCCKYPDANELPEFYNNFKASLMELPNYSLRGVKGRFLDKNGEPVLGATIEFIKGGKAINTTRNGYFLKNLVEEMYKTKIVVPSGNIHIEYEINVEVFDRYEPTDLTIIYVD